jgi:hypothetical protein
MTCCFKAFQIKIRFFFAFKSELMARGIWQNFVRDPHLLVESCEELKIKMLVFCFENHVVTAEGSLDTEMFRVTARFGVAHYWSFRFDEARIGILFRSGSWRFSREFSAAKVDPDFCLCGDPLSTYHVFTDCALFDYK